MGKKIVGIFGAVPHVTILAIAQEVQQAQTFKYMSIGVVLKWLESFMSIFGNFKKVLSEVKYP